MQVRTLRRGLQGTSVAVGLAAMGVAFYGAWGPLRLAEPSAAWRPRPPASSLSGESLRTQSSRWDLSSPFWDKPLRAIFARKPAEKKKSVARSVKASRPAQPRVRLPIKLIGTIVEPGRPFAVFTDAQGRCEVRGVGEQIQVGGVCAEVVGIERDEVVLRCGGQTVRIKLAANRPKWWR